MELPERLTDRELQILPYLVAGATRVEIAQTLKISAETVKIHTKNIVTKFHAENLRDGMLNMVAYQDCYGIGGRAMDRFMNFSEVLVTVFDPKRHFNVKIKNNITVMADTIDRLNFVINGTHADVIAKVDGVEVTSTSKLAGANAYAFQPSRVLHKFDVYEYELDWDFRLYEDDEDPFYEESYTFPAGWRSYSIQFADGVRVSDFGHRVGNGLHQRPNYPVKVQDIERGRRYFDPAPEFPLGFTLWWQP